MTPLSPDLAAPAWRQAVTDSWGDRFGAVEVTRERVELRSLSSVIELVAPEPYLSAQALLCAFTRAGIPPYLPVLAGPPSAGPLLLGPLVERHPDGLLILDGVHRCLAALRQGLETVWVSVLTAETHPPAAGSPVPLTEVTPSGSARTRTPLFRHTGNPDFRPTDVFLSRAQAGARREIERLRGPRRHPAESRDEDPMTNADYSWDQDSDLNDDRLNAAVVPQRYALTAPQVVVNSAKEILVVDPHPAGTWDTWMFPYASLILTRAELAAAPDGPDDGTRPVLAIEEGSTFRALSEALGQLRVGRQEAYVSAIRTGVNNVIADLNGTWSGRPFYTNYSLKFSRTSNSYTAYEFSYFLNHVTALDLDLPHVWIEPSRLAEELDRSETPFGRKVSSNVADALAAIRSSV
ncbi:hypothetical protein [Streptomyces microflavus]|uniref:hypothetical protein n=1 Tax=Streptomyces microflavus TaxID=1919 RepID=UPI00331E9C73